MGRVLVLLALGLAGCAQLFGLDETTGGDAQPGTPMMSLQLDRISIGATVTQAPLDLTNHTATYLIDDASEPSGLRRVQAALDDTKDRWAAAIPEGTAAALEFTVPDEAPSIPFRRLFRFPSRTVKTLFGVYEHANPEPAPAGGAFSVQLTLPTGYAAGQYFRLYAVGPWTMHSFVASELPAVDVGATTIGPLTIPYNTTAFPSLIGTRPLPRITAKDQLVALRYVGNDLTAAGTVTPFDQSGGTDTVTATLAPVTHAPLAVTIDPAAVAMRLSGTSPVVTTFSAAWSVVAAPAWQLANNSGPVLNAASVAATDPGAITTPVGNPFESLGWRSLFTWAANRSRTYTPPSLNLPVTLYAGLIQLDDVAPGLVLSQPAGLPVLVSINKTPLNVDGLSISLDPTKSVELGLVADRPMNLFYQWNVYELVPNTAMPPSALDYKIVYAALATETTVRIPHDVFVAGKVYTIRAHCVQGGYPAFATGDLKIRDVPYAVGYLDSGVFTVTAP